MAKQRKFPLVIKAGSTFLRIYRSPLKVAPKISHPDGQSTEGAGSNGSELKTYDSYVLSYYRLGKRQRQRFNSLEIAQTEAERVRTLILNEDLTALQLSGKERIIYARAAEVSHRHGMALDSMAREFDQARKILGNVSILEAAQFYDCYGKSVKETKSIPQIVEELLSGLRADNLSEYHIRDLTRRLGAFAVNFSGPIMSVRTKDISEWLRKLNGRDKKGKEVPLGAKTRNHYRNAVVQLFNFARDHGYLPKGLPTEAEAVKPLNVVPSANEILTAEEMTKLLQTAPPHLVVPLAIKAFSGVRTEEMIRLRWEHINWETRHICLPASVTKNSQRRLIPLSENLIAWIKPLRQPAGRICQRWQRSQALIQSFERHGNRQGIEVGANKFRNSFISYRVALTHDVQRVALESGNSPRVIQREYLELATEADGKKWFSISPAVHSTQPVD